MNLLPAMINLNTSLIITVLFTYLIYGCGSRNPDDQKSITGLHPDSLKEYLEYANLTLSEHEEKTIDQYVARHELKLIRTQTGLRYTIYRKGSGENANLGDIVIINYKIQLINGIEIESSDIEGPMELRVGKTDVVSGLHELLQYMNCGAKARAIIPSRIAYGFTGDQKKIPKGASLIYDIELLEIKI